MLPRPCLLLALLAAGCSASSGDGPTDEVGHGVLVIAVDALRADHLASHGHDRRTMRALDERMRAEGVLFEHAWSTGPGVVPAHVSLLTGCDPHVARQPQLLEEDLRTPLFNWFVPDDVPRLAEEFLASGWTTGAFVDHPSIAGLRGYRRGFRDYEEAGGEERSFGFEGVATRFVTWLEGRERGDRWFGYVHMNDLERMWLSEPGDLRPAFEARPDAGDVPPPGAHDPIFFAVPRPRVGEGTRSLGEYEARYDSALDLLDRSLARLFGRLEVIGRWEHTTVVLVGTFGFGFGEAGLVLDSGSLSPVDLHVPLWIRPAPAHHATAQARTPVTVSLTDVAPTALDLAGIPVPDAMHGRSLLDVLRGEHAGDAPRQVHASFASFPGFAVAEGPWLLEVSRPWLGPAPLARSWTGGAPSGPDTAAERVVLHDARRRLPLGVLAGGAPPPDDQLVPRLRAAGEAWAASMQRLQLALHLVPLGLDVLEPEDLQDLRRQGLLR